MTYGSEFPIDAIPQFPVLLPVPPLPPYFARSTRQTPLPIVQQVRSIIHRANPRVSDVAARNVSDQSEHNNIISNPVEARENLLDKEVGMGLGGQWRGDRTWTWPRFGYWSLKTGSWRRGGLRFLATDIVSTQKACSAGIPGWTRLLSGGGRRV